LLYESAVKVDNDHDLDVTNQLSADDQFERALQSGGQTSNNATHKHINITSDK